MRKPSPKIVKYRGSDTSKFVVEGLRVAGKRTRKFFPTRRTAEIWLRKTLARMRKEGESAIHMPEKLRIEAVYCEERLRPFGRTLSEATDHFLAHLAAIQRSCTIQTLIAEFKTAKEQDGASLSYLKDIKHRLGLFEDSFGSRVVAEIQPSEIDDWLRGLNVAGQTRNNFRTVLGTLFEFAALRGYAAGNPTLKIGKAKVVRGAPEIFTPQQMQKILEKAPYDFIPYLAIGGFAGLRSAELERLDWSEIDLGQRLIHVKAEKAKTAQRRLVPISANLAAWLAPHSKTAGPVVTSAREQRKKTCKAAKITWPANGLRHSFASYRLADSKDAATTAADLGHSSPVMLYKHYRELVSPDEATKWWQVIPPADYSNIVAYTKQAT